MTTEDQLNSIFSESEYEAYYYSTWWRHGMFPPQEEQVEEISLRVQRDEAKIRLRAAVGYRPPRGIDADDEV